MGAGCKCDLAEGSGAACEAHIAMGLRLRSVSPGARRLDARRGLGEQLWVRQHRCEMCAGGWAGCLCVQSGCANWLRPRRHPRHGMY